MSQVRLAPMSRLLSIPAPTERLLRRIGKIATENGMHAYAVGGCVRDWVLRESAATDLDVAVEGDGVAMAQAVAGALRGKITIHQQFGTATVTARRGRVDVATCRTETYAKPAAYPRVAAGTVTEDLFRRDFTINAMAVDLAPGRFGALLDPFDGLRDLTRKSLRVLHDRSFIDDPSRILRGIRFAQRFGLRWQPATWRAAQAAIVAGALGWLNAGRLRKELERMAQEPNPRACLAQLARLLGATGKRSV